MAHSMQNNWTRKLGPLNLSAMVLGLTEIVDGLGRVLSLGHLHLNLSYKFIFWHTLWECRRKATKS